MLPLLLRPGHLGHFTQEHTPAGRGFDDFFGFLFGSETHDSHNSWGRHTCNVPIIDLYNTSHRANESVHYLNMTYSPEMYAVEMKRLLEAHPDLKDHPFFLYMAFQNNHSPYTEVEQYTARYPDIPAGSMKRVYNSNMAALDDAIGTPLALGLNYKKQAVPSAEAFVCAILSHR